jgi:hypothetical protein
VNGKPNMIEIDGPQRANYTDLHSNVYEYTVYGIICKTAKECMDAYYNWYKNEELVGTKYIVWRSRPELVYDTYYKLTWRCHLVKLEGESVQYDDTTL